VKRICVDMDEVMADTLAEHLRRYNQEFDEALTVEDLAGKGLWDIASSSCALFSMQRISSKTSL